MANVERPAVSIGGVVLCGGLSSRMGRPKAWLEFQGEPLLVRIVRRIRPAVATLVVVAAAEQPLPDLPPEVLVVRDRQPGRGPLEGLRVGLATLAQLPQPPHAAFVTSCDAPFVSIDLARLLVDHLQAADQAVVPDDGERRHPLLAVYRLSVVAEIDRLLLEPRPRMMDLCDRVAARRLPADVLRRVDPDLKSLVNLNDEAELRRALE